MKRYLIIWLATCAGVVWLAMVSPAQNSTSWNFKMPCGYCHSLHDGPGAPLLKNVDTETMCLAGCHEAGGIGAIALGIVTLSHKNPANADYGVIDVTCLGCHNPHKNLQNADTSSTVANIKLIGKLVSESDDGTIARIRRPFINDVNGDNGGKGKVWDDDIHDGYYCTSAHPACDDPDGVGNPDGSANDHVRDVIFWDDCAADPANCTNNMFAQDDLSDPEGYNRMCNVCHTRASNHRRDNSGSNHGHNVTKACFNNDCHTHDKGWFRTSPF